jgi:hypothetical protein
MSLLGGVTFDFCEILFGFQSAVDVGVNLGIQYDIHSRSL